jgi:O-succinylbenzoic acid--CoA ligase
VIEDWLSAAAAVDPDRTFLVIGETAYSYADIDDRAARTAGGFARRGVNPGGRVALWANNDLATVVALFAIWRAGAACVLVNTRLTEPEVADQLGEASVSFVVDPQEREWSVPSINVDVQGRPHRGLPHKPGSECLIVFTSGSGGQGRGVVLSWANVDAGQAASAQHLGHTSDDVWLAVLPIFHVGGASILVRCAARGSTVLLFDRFEPEAVAAGLGRATLASFVATQLAAVLDQDERRFDVRAVLVGGGPAKQSLLDRAYRRGLGVLSTYGMTEAGSQIATSIVGEPPRRLVVPIPGAEMRLVDDKEIQVRGPMVTSTYLDAPARTDDGWLATGDLGELAEDGFRITGRTSDVIISGGENVMADEVKEALESLDLVRAAAVVGLRDETWGEIVAAAVELSAEVSFDELSDQLRASLAGYKIPKVWRSVESLPRTSLGKIRRQAVRNLFA